MMPYFSGFFYVHVLCFAISLLFDDNREKTMAVKEREQFMFYASSLNMKYVKVYLMLRIYTG